MSRRATTIASLCVMLIVLAGISMMAGRVWVPFRDWLDPADPRWAIIFELRLPRTILGVAVGAALGMSGAAMQGYTRNPLAEPSVLGASNAAALGAVVAIYFGLYALAGRATSFLAPFMVASVTALANSPRLGMAMILIFLAGGAAIMVGTPYPANRR